MEQPWKLFFFLFLFSVSCKLHYPAATWQSSFHFLPITCCSPSCPRYSQSQTLLWRSVTFLQRLLRFHPVHRCTSRIMPWDSKNGQKKIPLTYLEPSHRSDSMKRRIQPGILSDVHQPRYRPKSSSSERITCSPRYEPMDWCIFHSDIILLPPLLHCSFLIKARQVVPLVNVLSLFSESSSRSTLFRVLGPLWSVSGSDLVSSWAGLPWQWPCRRWSSWTPLI